jgi:hypothetical protein
MDNILATAASLSKDVESTRIDLIASVFQQFQSLQQEELQLDEHTVSIRRDYDLMQNNDTRPKECVILNNRDVFDQVKRAVNGASQSQASAIPKVGSKRQRTEL